MRKLTVILFLFGIFFFSYSDYAQNTTDNGGNGFNNTIGNLSTDAAKGYVGPAINGFGSNLNTGWITKAPSPTEFSFSLDIKIVAMGTVIDDGQKTFSTDGSFNFTESQATDIAAQAAQNDITAQNQIKQALLSQPWNVKISGPTIMGAEDQYVTLDFQGQQVQGYTLQNYTLTDVKGYLNNLSLFPTATLQLGIGTLLGTNVAIRWFPKVNIKDLGDFTYWGFGVVHNPAVWFTNKQFPVDIALGYFYQDLKVGTIFETKANLFEIFASKTFGSIIAFTPYIALTKESSTTTIQYDYTYAVDTGAGPVTETQNISFEMDGANSTGFTVGAAFKLAILNLNIDYKFANVKTASAGLTFGF